MLGPIKSDDRAAVNYIDVVLTFATLIMIGIVAEFLFEMFGLINGVADPLTNALFQLAVPLFIIALIISMGVAARS